ncbi:hypothetical protein Tco_0152269 [Tanacetum coccineum]
MVDEDKEIDENILSTEDLLSTDKEAVSTDKEKVSTDRPIVSTDGSKVSTDTEEQIESTDGKRKGTEDHTKEGSATQATQTPISTIFGDDETIAKVLLNMSQAKVVYREKEKGIDLKDKGKKKIEEEDESESESDGIPEAEKKNFDDIKARIEADRLLAKRLQEQEREQFTIEKRAKFLHDTIVAQRKFLAQQRSEAIRNRPPTKNQLRNQMMTYLKHVGNFKHAELKIKKFEEIQALYEKIKRSDEDFISIGYVEDERLIKRMNEKGVDSSKSEVIKEENKEEAKEENKEEESTRKRKLGTRKKMKSRKRRYIQNASEDDSEKENDELRLHLTIALDEEKEVDYEILDRKYPIKEWRTECLGTKPHDDKAEHYRKINPKRLVMDRYQGEIPRGFDKVLWGDLMVMFNPNDEDEFWNSQQDWNIVSWKLHSSSGVHTLVTETGLVIHMLVEKKYPLDKKVMVQMMKLKLESIRQTACVKLSNLETSGGNLGGHSSSDKSLSGNEGDMTLQSVYDLCLSLCAQVSDQAKEIQHLKAQITKLKKQAKPVIKHHRAWLKSASLKQRLARKRSTKKQRMNKESVSKQGRKFAKGESSVQRDPLFDEVPEDTVDHMETENAQDEGRTRDIVDEDKEIEENILSTEEAVSTDKEKVSIDIPIVSTDGSKVSTDRQIEGTDDQNKGTEEQIESTDGHKKGTKEEIATQTTQTPTSTIFRDDETIAKVLLNMSQAKVVSREKEKGVELKDIEETDRPRPTSTRLLLTLKPLPKIDPKDKGKKKIEEEDESESESDGIPEAEKKFKQLENDEEMARKIQEEWEGKEERNIIVKEKAANEALIRNFDNTKARIEADRLLAEKLQEQERE